MTSNAKKGSEAIYKIKAEKNVYVPMRDGVRLAVDIFRPDSDGKFPALVAICPYGKEIQSMELPPQPSHSVLLYGSIEAGNSDFIVSRGYVHVICDVRGTGRSEGEFTNIYAAIQATDGYDLIEWIAQQPWSDGNVGMIGISYFGVIQLMVAIEQPPHLKAIFPYDANNDRYRDGTYDGGILGSFYMYLANIMLSANNLVSETLKNTPPDELERLIEERANDPEIKNNPAFYSILMNPRKNPIFFDIMMHPTDGPFYWDRSPYRKFDKIKIPCYLGSGWYAYAYTHLPGAFRAYAGIEAPKKLIIGPPVFLERPFHQYHEEIIRWNDHWLKGIDTGIMDEPPIKIFVMGRNQWRYDQEWPLPNTTWTKFYLRSWERLSRETEKYYEEPDCFVQMPPTMTRTVQSLQYMTEPLAEDIEVTGPIALYIYASIDAEDTNWIVSILDVDQNGSEKELTRGWLKASHRQIDKEKSKPWQPYHPHTKPSPVVPDQIYQYAIEIRPTSNLFRAGHRLKLQIASLDLPATLTSYRPSPTHLACSKTTLHRIYRDESHPSYLLLPVVT